MKRIIITTLVALAVVAVVVPGVTQALTVQDLMTQISQVQAQINALNGQEANGSTTGVLPSACVGITFTRDLDRSMVGSDVQCMQAILNQLNVKVADAGAGSPGNETTFFGGATRAAVIRFQVMFNISPAVGYVGPLTRAKLNSLIGQWSVVVTPPVTPPTGCTSTSGFNPTTGASCAVTGLPAGCTSTAGYSPTTGANCSTGVVTQPVVTLPAGCTSTAGYSQTTGVSCSTGVSNPVLGSTGFLSLADIAATPASNANVTATTNVPVLGLDLKAIGANLTVTSAKVELAVTRTDTGATQYPSTLVQNLYVYDGSTLLGTFPVNSNTITVDSSTGTNVYYMILSGFNFMIPGNTTKTLTINADFASGLDQSRKLVIGLYGSGAIRATDPSGAYSTDGSGATARNYTITYSTVGTSTLTASIDANTPVATDVAVSYKSGTTNIPVSVFDLKSTTGASQITQVVVTVGGVSSGSLVNNTLTAEALGKVNAVDLYDGSTLLGSQSISCDGTLTTGGTTANPTLACAVGAAGTTGTFRAIFSNLTDSVAQDATKYLTAKVDMASGVTNASYLTLSLAANAVSFNEPNMSSGNSTGVATGNNMYFYDGGAPAISFVSGTASYVANQQSGQASSGVASGVLTFSVTSNGGTTTEPVLADFTVVACATSDTLCASPVTVSKAIQVTPTNSSGIANNGIASVAISASFNKNSLSGYYFFKVTSVNWAMTGVTTTPVSGYVPATGQATDNDSSAILNWKTNPVYVY